MDRKSWLFSWKAGSRNRRRNINENWEGSLGCQNEVLPSEIDSQPGVSFVFRAVDFVGWRQKEGYDEIWGNSVGAAHSHKTHWMPTSSGGYERRNCFPRGGLKGNATRGTEDHVDCLWLKKNHVTTRDRMAELQEIYNGRREGKKERVYTLFLFHKHTKWTFSPSIWRSLVLKTQSSSLFTAWASRRLQLWKRREIREFSWKKKETLPRERWRESNSFCKKSSLKKHPICSNYAKDAGKEHRFAILQSERNTLSVRGCCTCSSGKTSKSGAKIRLKVSDP